MCWDGEISGNPGLIEVVASENIVLVPKRMLMVVCLCMQTFLYSKPQGIYLLSLLACACCALSLVSKPSNCLESRAFLAVGLGLTLLVPLRAAPGQLASLSYLLYIQS